MRKITTIAMMLILMLALTAGVALAQEEKEGRSAQYGQYPTGVVEATGVLERAAPHSPDPTPIYAITDEATGTSYELTSGFVELESFVGQRVAIEGVPVPGSPPPDAPLFLNVTSIASADDPGEGSDVGVLGTVTSISGSVVLVEENPSAESGDKGSFTVTEETEITRQEDGEAVPATFEDLEVGQLVEATYAGDVAQSYPTQGNAGSIAILEDPSTAPGETATLTFELTVEGQPPAGATFSGLTSIESFIATPLTDPDGDGLYAGSMIVPATGGGQGGPPEPLSLPVQIVQDGAAVIKDFGLVKIDGDKTFEASVSFGGSQTPKPNDPGESGNGVPVVSGDTNDVESAGVSGGGISDGGAGGGIKTLPATGGALTIVGLLGAVLVGGGLLTHRISRQ